MTQLAETIPRRDFRKLDWVIQRYYRHSDKWKHAPRINANVDRQVYGFERAGEALRFLTVWRESLLDRIDPGLLVPRMRVYNRRTKQIVVFL